MKLKNIFCYIICLLFLNSCTQSRNDDEITFGVTADYPPFEYISKGKLKGFDIDLANIIGEKLNKKVVFNNIEFYSIFPSLKNGTIDAAISTITSTNARKENFDFSDVYYYEILSVIFNKDNPITSASDLENKKIACQLGTTMEIWLRKNISNAEIITTNNNNQAVESLKAKHVDAVLIDFVQAKSFVEQNKNTLANLEIARTDDGYSVALNKNSPLLNDINKIIAELKENGELLKLQDKWLNNDDWINN
jgi:polar amino acid transport system substrate-binding protein